MTFFKLIDLLNGEPIKAELTRGELKTPESRFKLAESALDKEIYEQRRAYPTRHLNELAQLENKNLRLESISSNCRSIGAHPFSFNLLRVDLRVLVFVEVLTSFLMSEVF